MALHSPCPFFLKPPDKNYSNKLKLSFVKLFKAMSPCLPVKYECNLLIYSVQTVMSCIIKLSYNSKYHSLMPFLNFLSPTTTFPFQQSKPFQPLAIEAKFRGKFLTKSLLVQAPATKTDHSKGSAWSHKRKKKKNFLKFFVITRMLEQLLSYEAICSTTPW